MLSIAIEFTQTFFPPRTPDLFDILGESVGAFLGAIAWIGFGQKITRSCRAIWSPYTTDFSQLLAGYLGFLVLSRQSEIAMLQS
jgi:glycopeptide antibiotics resistance protein